MDVTDSTTATPAAGTTEAVTEAPIAPSLEAIKAERRAAIAEGKTQTPAKTEDKPADDTTKTAEINLDEKALSKFVEESKHLRALNETKRELETKSKLADNWTKATKLIAEGKNFDAIQLLGPDVLDAAIAEATSGGKTAPTVDPKLKALEDEIATLKANQTKTQEEIDKEKQTVATKQREEGIAKVVEAVKGNADKFPFLSRSPEWVKTALAGAEEAYPILVKKHGRDLTPAERDTLLTAALEEGEAFRAKEAGLYGAPKPVAAPAQKPTPKTIDRTIRTAQGGMRRNTGSTLDELKAERRKAAGR